MRRSTVVLVAATLALGGCSLLGPDTMESLRNRGGGGGGCRPYDSLDDLLGNTSYRTGDAAPRPLTVAVAVGRFDSVEPGRAFVVPGGDAPGGQATDFDANDAVWKTLEATFSVEQVLSGDVQVGDQVAVGLAFGPDADPGRAERDLTGLGTVVLFLDRSPVFAHDPDLLGTAADGSLITVVAEDGRLSLPGREPDEARSLLSATPTLDSLEAAAARPPRTVVTDPTGCQVVR